MKKIFAFAILFTTITSAHAASNNSWQLIDNKESIECVNKKNSHKIIIEYGDICASKCQAIVNAANAQLQNGGGVCGAIFKQAGLNKLQSYIDEKFPHGCQTGQAVITPSFDLQKKEIQHIIHAVGPVWQGGQHNEHQLLADTYHNSLLVAQQNNIESIAFPFISSGIYKFPLNDAARIAIESVIKHADLVKEIKIVLFSDSDYQLFKEIIKKISSEKKSIGLAVAAEKINKSPNIFQRIFLHK